MKPATGSLVHRLTQSMQRAAALENTQPGREPPVQRLSALIRAWPLFTRVDVAAGRVTLESETPVRDEAVRALAELGYPEPGANKLSSKAKSFVSCAIGRVSGNGTRGGNSRLTRMS